MTIKIILLVLTLVLLANEFGWLFPKTQSRNKRIFLIIVFGLTTLFSLIDVYNDNEDFNKLKEKSDEIFSKSEDILGRVIIPPENRTVS